MPPVPQTSPLKPRIPLPVRPPPRPRSAEDSAAAVDGSLVGGVTAVPDEKNDTVKLTILGRNGQEIASTDIPGGTGSGGNTYNVTEEVPWIAATIPWRRPSLP